MTTEVLVHVIDDDAAMRDSLAFLMDSAGMAVRTYDSASAFIAEAPRLSGGCVVTDMRMPGMNGLEMTRQLKALNVDLPIIMITGHGDVPLAVEAMKAGVADFLEKPFDDDALLRAIRAALDRTAADRAGRDAEPFQALLSSLSPRETEVLRGVVLGKANKVIAFELGISPRTVEVYRSNVMSKTGAAGLSELIRMALTAGLA